MSHCGPSLLAVVVPNVGGILGGLITKKNLKPWFESLKKPKWILPNWAFAPAWTVLYSSMGYGSYLVWKHGNGFNGPAKIPLLVYSGHLALNWAWSPIFFGKHDLKLAFYDILALDVAAAATAVLFYQVVPKAGLLFIPYLMWLGFASALNYNMYKNNQSRIEAID